MKVGFIAARAPYPLNSGGRIRTYHLLKQVAAVHRVTLFTAIERGEEAALVALRDELSQVAVRAVTVPPRNASLRRVARLARNPFDLLPYTWAAFKHSAFVDNVRRGVTDDGYDIMHCDHVQVAESVPRSPTTPRVLNAHNVESVLVRRLAERQTRPWRRAAVAWQARKTFAAEVRAWRSFDHCVAVSMVDAAEIRRLAPTVPITVVPNGVDVDAFAPSPSKAESGIIVFSGAMDWAPNIEGVTWFVRHVFPRIKREIPHARFLVVGRNPSPPLVRQLSGNGVDFTDTVSDVRPYVARASVVAVPLLSGSGTRLKILEAWALGKAVVTTTLGAEGLPAAAGANALFADSVEAFAAESVKLLRDANAAHQLGTAGRRIVEEQFAWKHVADALLHAYEHTVAAGRCV